MMVEGSPEVTTIVESQMEKYSELREVLETTCMVEKLFSRLVHAKTNVEGCKQMQAMLPTATSASEIDMPRERGATEGEEIEDNRSLRPMQADNNDTIIMSSTKRERLKRYGDLN